MADRPQTRVGAEELIEQVRRRVFLETMSEHPAVAVRMYSGAIRISAVEAGEHDWDPSSAQANRCTSGDEREVAARLTALDECLASAFEEALLGVGQPPPVPTSLRGRIGRLGILLLRRLFWWYTRSLMGFGDAVSKQFRDELALLALMVRKQQVQGAEIAALLEEVRRLRERPTVD